MKEAVFTPLVDLALIFDCVADAVLAVDAGLRLTYINRAAEEATSFSRQEVLGRPCHEVFRGSCCQSNCPLASAIATRRPVAVEYDILSRLGGKIPISASASPLYGEQGEIVGAVQTFRDFSPNKLRAPATSEHFSYHGIVSRSPAMRALFDIMPDVAASEATVLLQGESGTGKELFANALHRLSPRCNGPLVVVNCGALPEPLLEAEIFGARRGAYTGSYDDRPGRLEMARGGTLVLDEIGDLPLPLQVKLLRVLENHEFQPLGARLPQKADVRFVASTNCNLEKMVDEGRFRRDLFFRINVVALQIPPLRERREDIPLLIDYFLQRYSHLFGKTVRGLSPEVYRLCQQHSYPGNIRELLNLIEQAVILCRRDEIGVEDLPGSFIGSCRRSAETDFRWKKPSPELLQQTLERHEGRLASVAKELGVDRTTVWRWLKTTTESRA
jgi:PAS domain S-box-containing protein